MGKSRFDVFFIPRSYYSDIKRDIDEEMDGLEDRCQRKRISTMYPSFISVGFRQMARP